MSLHEPFAYPAEPHLRMHGPDGYAVYESYRDWLRDEFSFRCVFCLHREQWGIRLGAWDIDHFVPQSQDASLLLSYDNLLYVCHTCNSVKSDSPLPDPTSLDLSKCLHVRSDGSLVALNDDGRIISEILRLDNDERRNFRRMIISTVKCLARHDRTTMIMWMCYPDELPDLSKLRPPSNSKPEGIKNSAYARRERGQLPPTY